MAIVRVKAIYIENGVPSSDYMVIDTWLNRDGMPSAAWLMGFSKEDGEIYPFIIQEQGSDNKARVQWGDFSEEACISHTNFRNKSVRVGELFTRVDQEDGEINEWTYRIHAITTEDQIR